jgi:hypothetical protein
MKHIKVFENFLPATAAEETFPIDTPMADAHFEAESTEIMTTDGNTEGNYFVNFTNSEGEKTTIEICGANDPEFLGDSMVSDIEMVPDSSSDGKKYSVVGYYDEIPESGGAYELKKVLIEEV